MPSASIASHHLQPELAGYLYLVEELVDLHKYPPLIIGVRWILCCSIWGSNGSLCPSTEGKSVKSHDLDQSRAGFSVLGVRIYVCGGVRYDCVDQSEGSIRARGVRFVAYAA